MKTEKEEIEEIKMDLSENENIDIEKDSIEESENKADCDQKDDLDESSKLKEQLAKLSDDYLRLMAEYDNYRKRTLKEKSELIKNGGEKTIRDLLPVIDDFDIALKNIPDSEEIKSFKEGISMIHNKFTEFLNRNGVKEIVTANVKFDDDFHEAIAIVPSDKEEDKGNIIECVKKGYTLNDKVIRHATVVVYQ